MLGQPWTPSVPVDQQPRYQPIKYCTHSTVLGSFNNCNIILLSHKATSTEDIDKINKVVLDGISDNMDTLVQTGHYGAMNKTDKNTMGLYVIKLILEACALKE